MGAGFFAALLHTTSKKTDRSVCFYFKPVPLRRQGNKQDHRIDRMDRIEPKKYFILYIRMLSFVEMPNAAEGQAAIIGMNGKELIGRAKGE